MTSRRVFSLLVDNTSGVLSRVSGLFSRRGYNIDSITAGVTADPRLTRLTVVAHGDELILEQIEKQLRKLEDVVAIKTLEPDNAVCRELVMIKIAVLPEQRQSVVAISEIFRSNIVDVSPQSLTLEVTGDQSKVNALISLLEGYEILELARTGITGLSRGTSNIAFID